MADAEFNPVNELEEVLVRAAQQPGARPEFYQKLIDSEIWLLTIQPQFVPGTPVPATDGGVQLASWSGTMGDYVPIFSSLEQLQAAIGLNENSYGCMVLKGSEVFSMLTQHPGNVILNPGASFGRRFGPDEIERLADGTMPGAEEAAVPTPTQVLLSQPAEYPHALVSALQEFFAKTPSVEAAYLAQIDNPASDNSAHLLIGIQCGKDMPQVAPAAVAVANGLTGLNRVVDFVPVDGGQGPFDSYFQAQTTPFYRRKEAELRR